MNPALEIAFGEPVEKLLKRRVRVLLRGGPAAREDGCGRLAHPLHALHGETRLADPRGAEDRDELRAVLTRRAFEVVRDLCDLARTTDERSLQPTRQRRRVWIDRLDRPRFPAGGCLDRVAH
jgi:hypothetical protein